MLLKYKTSKVSIKAMKYINFFFEILFVNKKSVAYQNKSGNQE